jgi:hypothetical protein
MQLYNVDDTVNNTFTNNNCFFLYTKRNFLDNLLHLDVYYRNTTCISRAGCGSVQNNRFTRMLGNGVFDLCYISNKTIIFKYLNVNIARCRFSEESDSQ